MYGTCPRVLCMEQALIPYGVSEVPGTSLLRTYCPTCNDIYSCQKDRHESVDGAFFGPNFAHMLAMSYPDEFKNERSKAWNFDKFPIKLYGYKVHESATSRPPTKLVYCVETGGFQAVKKVPPKCVRTIEAEEKKVKVFIKNI